MKLRTWLPGLGLLLALLAAGAVRLAATPAAGDAPAVGTVSAPVLKWQRGGCYSSWCETGWYASPAVADLDGDGANEVLGGGYTLFVLRGSDGSEQWHAPAPGGGRMWPGPAVADLDGDGDLEVVTAHGGGTVRVLDHAGHTVWTRHPADRELRGLALFDLDDDGTLEIVVSGAVLSRVNTWVYEHNGGLRPGWPQLANDSGYAYGVFNDNVALGDLDGDRSGAELVVPSDVHYINAYEPDGTQIPAHAMYGQAGWGLVGVWESLATELRGWGTCSGARAERYRTNFAHGAAVIADVNGDGINEVVVTGNVYDCQAGHPPGKYNGVYLFNADRSRFNQDGHDWRTPPVDTGAPLSEDYGVIENNQPNPVVADLDGDGQLEILFSSYDGRVHAYWLDKTEHFQWPFSVYASAEGVFRFATEPVVADLDADGLGEVLFASWPQKGGNRTGKLHVLDYQGRVLHEVALPAPFSGDWNGALAAPTLANIDADAELELVLNTAHSGLVAYDLPGTAAARILWGTGRGNQLRSGSRLQGSLDGSVKEVWPVVPEPGDLVTYTITLRNPGPDIPAARVTDTLPAGITYGGGLWATAGTVSQDGDRVTWQGAVRSAEPVTIGFRAAIDAGLSGRPALTNQAAIDDGAGTILVRSARAVVNGRSIWLPAVNRASPWSQAIPRLRR